MLYRVFMNQGKSYDCIPSCQIGTMVFQVYILQVSVSYVCLLRFFRLWLPTCNAGAAGSARTRKHAIVFGILRRSNLFPVPAHQFSPRKQFLRSDFSQLEDGSICVNVKYSKTNQFQKRSFELKLLPVDHILCPFSAIHKAFALICLPPGAPALWHRNMHQL